MLLGAFPSLCLVGALLDIDGRTLRDSGATLATLVMFTSPACDACLGLRPHIEEMQGDADLIPG